MRYRRRTMDPEDLLAAIEARLGYTFRDPTLLRDALTHRSFVNERPDLAPRHNERMEYLGDSIFGFAASVLLYHHYPDAREGELTRRRADMVCEPALSAIATHLGLGEALRLGHGEEKSGGREKPRLLASALEALIAAVYLDSDEHEPIALARALLSPYLDVMSPGELDYKSRLQETLQADGDAPPVYDHVRADGPDHERVFHVQAIHQGRVIGEGAGGSKLRAEQLAARAALEAMDSEEE